MYLVIFMEQEYKFQDLKECAGFLYQKSKKHLGQTYQIYHYNWIANERGDLNQVEINSFNKYARDLWAENSVDEAKELMEMDLQNAEAMKKWKWLEIYDRHFEVANLQKTIQYCQGHVKRVIGKRDMMAFATAIAEMKEEVQANPNQQEYFHQVELLSGTLFMLAYRRKDQGN